MFLLYLFVCNCTCECMFCVGDHLVQAILPFVLPIFGKIDNNNNNSPCKAHLHPRGVVGQHIGRCIMSLHHKPCVES